MPVQSKSPSDESSAGAISMDQIAALAGVATSTVSRALRGDPRISEVTRTRIREISKRNGYRPNPMVAALMAQLRHGHPPAARCNLAWLDLLPRPDDWQDNPVHAAFYSGAVTRSQRLGYSINRIHAHALSTARLARTLSNRGILGVLVPPFDDGSGIGTRIPLPLENFTVVGVGTRFEQPGLHYSSDDQYEYGRLAVQKLWALGYRRIGYVGEHRVEKIVNGRFFAGYYSTIYCEFGGAPLPPLLTKHDSEMIPWLHQTGVDAIVTANRRILSVLRRGSVRVPEDVAVAHLNVDDVEHASPGEVAGIRQDNVGVGANAVELLVSLLYHNEVGVPIHPRGLEIHGTWVHGRTAPAHSPGRKRPYAAQ